MKATYSILITGKKLVFYSFVLLMSQCNKYDNTIAAANLQVPPYTETGANTFGCLVNGKAWANFGESRGMSPIGPGPWKPNLVTSGFYFNTTINDTVFSVSAWLTVSKNGNVIRSENMFINVPKNGSLLGVHQLSNSNNLFIYPNFITGYSYASIVRNPFIVTIKKDSITTYPHHIVSGTFNGTLYNYAQSDSLRIVGGVFDVLVQ